MPLLISLDVTGRSRPTLPAGPVAARSRRCAWCASDFGRTGWTPPRDAPYAGLVRLLDREGHASQTPITTAPMAPVPWDRVSDAILGQLWLSGRTPSPPPRVSARVVGVRLGCLRRGRPGQPSISDLPTTCPEPPNGAGPDRSPSSGDA
jgi:hypothetical protein